MDYSQREEKERKYRTPINYESGVLVPKLREVSFWRDSDLRAYESGVVTLALILPKELRKKALDFFGNNTIKEDLTKDGKKDFDDLFVYILELLEDANICFPKIQYHEGLL